MINHDQFIDIARPATEIEVAKAINDVDIGPDTKDTIRRLAFERDRTRERLRTTCQALIAAIGADGPCNAEEAAVRIAEANGKEISQLVAERCEQLNAAITLLAEWCWAIERKGAGWDDWEEFYKAAAYRDGPLRKLIDDKIEKIKKDELAEKQSCDDLAASGGIVDAQ